MSSSNKPGAKVPTTTATTPNKTVEVLDEDMVEVVATARGFDSSSGRTIEAGESFYVNKKTAQKGATWFDYASAETKAAHKRQIEATKARAKAGSSKAPSPSAKVDEELADAGIVDDADVAALRAGEDSLA